jgi:hypothetical protein
MISDWMGGWTAWKRASLLERVGRVARRITFIGYFLKNGG